MSSVRAALFATSRVIKLPKRTFGFGKRQSASLVPSIGIYNQVRKLGVGPTSKDFQETTVHTGPLTKLHATDLILRITNEERQILLTAIQEYESKLRKESYEGRLASQTWRTSLGRPSVTSLGEVDPTGTYCPMPEDWLQKKFAETSPKPTTRDLLQLMIFNAVPFVGFGFMDNFIMLVAGDSIESSMSSYITLSTMAAAALGNTFSDIIGIGSSGYVERAVTRLGLKPPKLTPVQLDMTVSRRFTNLGRVFGITVGCILGMAPLLFRD